MYPSKIIITIIALTEIIISSNEYISIPFYHNKPSEKLFYENSLLNPPYTKFKIGNPSQEITLKITFKYCPLSISGKETLIPNVILYDKSKSKTYKNLGNEIPSKIFSESFNYYLNSSETFDFGNDKFSDIKFNYVTEINKKENETGIFGLNLKTMNLGLKEFNLINQLKKENLISSYSFYFKYNEENKGELIIGNYPHEINNKYSEENSLSTKLEIDSFLNTKIEVKYIKYGNIDILDNTINNVIQLSFDFGLIYGNEQFKNVILDNYFQKYLDDNKCIVKIINDDYESFICDKNINLKEFQNLNVTLFGNEGNKIYFIFTYEDLFTKIEDKYYFLIYFSKNVPLNIFKFGRQFFKKYIVVFNQDKKIVTFYNNKDFGSYFKQLSWIILIICLIIIGFLFAYIYQLKRNKRKKQAHELEEEYQEYINKDEKIN
jgi:hypothetical protein